MKTTFTRTLNQLLLIAALCSILPVAGQGQQADIWDGSIAAGFSEGTGEPDAPYKISSGAQLAFLAQEVNSGNTSYNDKNYLLTNDIDLNHEAWTPIGIYRKTFKGNFDGGSHTINNLYVPTGVLGSANRELYGFFGYIEAATDITIKNLGVIISEKGIENSTGIYNGGCCIGGMAATIVATQDIHITIKNCFARINKQIEGQNESNRGIMVGGLIGYLETGDTNATASIDHCYACVGKISVKTRASEGACAAGGILGAAWAEPEPISITNCLAFCCDLASDDLSNIPKVGNLVGSDESYGRKYVKYTNCYSSPLTSQTLIDSYSGTTTKYLTGPGSQDKNGVFLTNDNFDIALDGWEAAGWHLNGDCLPVLRVGADSPAKADYLAMVGDGTQITPFQITSENHLRYLLFHTNALQVNPTTSPTLRDSHCTLADDLRLSFDWTPIADFEGVFDGNGHVISGLNIPASAGAEAAGLFATLKSGAAVSKLGVTIKEEVTASGGSAGSGGIAGKCESGATIEHCFVASGKITGKAAGGIAGTNAGTIKDCYATTPITGAADASVGGICGSNTGSIQNGYVTGKITGTETGNKAGGISGSNTGTIENCLALNKEGISGTTGQGRIVGENTNTLNGNYVYPLIPGTWTNEGADQTDGADWEGDSYPFPATRAITVWDMTTDPTLLPRLQAFIDKGTQQPADNLPKIAYQTFKVTLSQPATGGTISVTYTGGSLPDGDTYVPINTVLTLSATPADGYQFKTFTADAAPIGSNTHTVNANVTLSATFEPIPAPPVTPDPDPVPDPSPTVYYTITLPAVEGATTDPAAGTYEVEAWGSFRFYLTLDKEYDKSEPVVKTDRFETITPRSSDGAYIVKYVRNDVDIFIDGIVKNPDPVGNEVVATDAVKVWATKSNLHISTVTGQTAKVYNLAGSLVKQAEIPAGDTFWPLPSGIYIVQIADTRYKVIL